MMIYIVDEDGIVDDGCIVDDGADETEIELFL